MPLGDLGKGSQCSNLPHIHTKCKLCGEFITAFHLRHNTHEVDDAQDTASIEKATVVTNEPLNSSSEHDALNDRTEIPNQAAGASSVDTPLTPKEKELPSINATAELGKDEAVSPVHQNHVQGKRELAEGVASQGDTGPKLPPHHWDEKRDLRFSLATDIKASESAKEHVHKKNTSSRKTSEFVDYRSSPPTVKNLYWSAGRWSEYANADIEAKELRRMSERDDIVHRQIMRADANDSGQLWETFSVIVRGSLKRMLQERVFKDHPAIGNPNADELVLTKPFTPVVHRWKMLEDLLNESTTPFGVEALKKILLPCVENQLSVIDQIRSSGLCAWEDLNLILCPGEIILSQQYGVQAAFKIQNVYRREPPYQEAYQQVLLQYVDWNGQHCGHESTSVKIMKFLGSRDISTLDVVALASLDKQYQADIRAKFQSRGRKFERLRGYHFKTGNGRRVVLELNEFTGQMEPIEKPVNGRVIVDACAFYQCQDIAVPRLGRFSQSSQTSTNDNSRKDSSDSSEDSNSQKDGVGSDSEAESDSSSDRSSYASQTVDANTLKPKKAMDINTFQREEDFTPMTDEQCLLANPFVKGMDVKSKEWSEFLVDEIEEIQWIDEMFEKLVLPSTHKKVALASVKHRTSSMDMDFVPGKGRGLVMLMFGPPGVGKTLTAEAAEDLPVAEKSRVPLYSISAGELGTNPSQLEKALTNALNCCTLWHAVLLLDEADIFLATRTLENLERNELVSIFLRLVEHYQGVLFLTTNRMEVIDPAFQSRVDFILPYTGLTVEAREEVWRNLITRAGAERMDVSDEDIRDLAKLNLNGREIKNLLKSAMLLDDKVSAKELHSLALMRVDAQKLLGIE